MTTLNQGRNEIRFNNSSGKCLLENWVEERAVDPLDGAQDINNERASGAQLFKDGHNGLLTIDLQAPPETLSTCKDSYRLPSKPNVATRGKKAEFLEKMYFEEVSKEVHKEFNPPPEPVDYRSITNKDYNIQGFVSTKPTPTTAHDYVCDQPVSFWTEHKNTIHGRSQIKTLDTPFKKNTAFSKPIDEYWNESAPYEQDNIPRM